MSGSTYLLQTSAALACAARGGHVATMQWLLDAHVDIDQEDPRLDMLTPLGVAARHGHETAARLLLEYGASVNGVDHSYAPTPVLEAVMNGHADVVECLTHAKADVNRTPALVNLTPLYCARSVRVVRHLVQANADVNQVSESKDATPLFGAAELGLLAVARALLEAKADANRPTSCPRRVAPLHVAARNGNVAMARTLLRGKARVDAIMECGESALFLAAKHRHLHVLRLLLAAKADVHAGPLSCVCKPLWVAATTGAMEIVHALVEAKCDVDGGRCRPGETPCTAAASRGFTHVIQYLLSAKANPDRGADAGDDFPWVPLHRERRSPLHAAAIKGHVPAALVLLQAKATVHAGTDGTADDSVLAAAAAVGHMGMLDLLLQVKCDGSRRLTSGGWSLAHVAAAAGHADAARMLQLHGAPPYTLAARTWRGVSVQASATVTDVALAYGMPATTTARVLLACPQSARGPENADSRA
jgi:ankyrin repeat protein